MENSKIISLEEWRIQRDLKNSRYEGSITITANGASIEDAFYRYELEYIEPEDTILFLKDTLRELMSNITQISVAPKKILNKSVTILYYMPLNMEDNRFYFEWDIEEMTEEELIALLSCCVLNIEK